MKNSEVKADKKLKNRKKLIIILLSVFLSLAVVLGAGYWVFKENFSYEYKEVEKTPENLGFETVKDERIINIALFGIDTRSAESFSGRSDTMMILSINEKNGKIKLISVMRDSLVPIEQKSGRVHSKMNSAYAWGGPELAIKTLNTIFDLDISEYVTINFFKLVDIVDMVGGVEITLGENELSFLNGAMEEICKGLGLDTNDYKVTSAGKQHLNGIQAVAFSRIRYTHTVDGTNNDYGRTDRQRLVMEQMLKKVLAMKKTDCLKLIKPILASCQTSLNYSEVLDVVMNILSDSPVFEETRIPEQRYLMTSPKGGFGSVVYYDLNFAAKLIHGFIYDDITPDKYIEQNGIEKNDWYKKGFTPISIPHAEQEPTKEVIK